MPNTSKYPHPYPFGLMMLGRSWSDGYRFGFNGQEQDDEVYGEGILNTALYWEYDTRLGRRWNVDPVPYSEFSSYATFRNNPNFWTDLNGDEVKNDEEATVKENQRNVDEATKRYNEMIGSYQGKITKRVEKSFYRESGLKDAKLVLENSVYIAGLINDMINTFETIMPNEFNEINTLVDINGNPIDVIVSYNENYSKYGSANYMGTDFKNADIFYSTDMSTGETGRFWNGTFSGPINIYIYNNYDYNPFQTQFLANEFGDILFFNRYVVPNDVKSLEYFFSTGSFPAGNTNQNHPYYTDPNGAGQFSFDIQKRFNEAYNDSQIKHTDE